MPSSYNKQILLEEIKSTIYESTFHGLPRILISIRKKQWFASIMWIILFFGSTSYCIFTIITCITDYYSYDVAIDISKIQKLPAPFPAVTICNINPFNEANAQSKLLSLDNKASCFLTLNGNSFENCVNQEDPQMAFQNLIDQYTRIIANDNNLTLTDYMYLGYKLESDMLVSCEYNGGTCTPSDFETFWHNKYGLCYTFNANSSLSTSETGSSCGLKLELVVGE